MVEQKCTILVQSETNTFKYIYDLHSTIQLLTRQTEFANNLKVLGCIETVDTHKTSVSEQTQLTGCFSS